MKIFLILVIHLLFLPPLTDSNFRIFGKNSDRPANEVQEIIFVSNEHTSDNKDFVQV